MTEPDWKIWGDGLYHHYVVMDCPTPWWLRLFGYPATRRGHFIDGALDHYEALTPEKDR